MQPKQQQKYQRALTLVEVLIVVAVIAIGLTVGVPAFTGMVANSHMSDATNALVSAIQTARSEALKRRQRINLCATPGGTGACQGPAVFAQGWTLYADLNDNGSIDADEPVILRHGTVAPALEDRITVTPDDGLGYVSFLPSGILDTAARSISGIQLCDARGDVDTGGGVAAGRWLQIQPMGRVELERRRARLQDRGSNPLGGC